MAFGFLKKAFGVVKSAVKVATKVASFAPGVGGPVAAVLKVASGALAKDGRTVANVVLAARQGVTPILQQISAGQAPVSAAVLSKVSNVMPGGTPAGGGGGSPWGRAASKAASRKSTKARARKAKLKARRRGGATRRRSSRRRLTRAQLRAGFGGRRRMRG